MDDDDDDDDDEGGHDAAGDAEGDGFEHYYRMDENAAVPGGFVNRMNRDGRPVVYHMRRNNRGKTKPVDAALRAFFVERGKPAYVGPPSNTDLIALTAHLDGLIAKGKITPAQREAYLHGPPAEDGVPPPGGGWIGRNSLEMQEREIHLTRGNKVSSYRVRYVPLLTPKESVVKMCRRFVSRSSKYFPRNPRRPPPRNPRRPPPRGGGAAGGGAAGGGAAGGRVG